MVEYTRIFISRTQKEWELIERRLKERGKSGIPSYLRSQINSLKKSEECCPDYVSASVGNKFQKTIYLTQEQIEILNLISDKTGIPEGVIINKLFLEPLLSP